MVVVLRPRDQSLGTRWTCIILVVSLFSWRWLCSPLSHWNQMPELLVAFAGRREKDDGAEDDSQKEKDPIHQFRRKRSSVQYFLEHISAALPAGHSRSHFDTDRHCDTPEAHIQVCSLNFGFHRQAGDRGPASASGWRPVTMHIVRTTS